MANDVEGPEFGKTNRNVRLMLSSRVSKFFGEKKKAVIE